MFYAISIVTGATAVLCGLFCVFAARSGRVGLAIAFAGVAAGALQVGQQVG